MRSDGPSMPPTLADGKICYIEFPTTYIARLAHFYRQVFAWNIRKRGDGSTAFDDTAGGEVSDCPLSAPRDRACRAFACADELIPASIPV